MGKFIVGQSIILILNVFYKPFPFPEMLFYWFLQALLFFSASNILFDSYYLATRKEPVDNLIVGIIYVLGLPIAIPFIGKLWFPVDVYLIIWIVTCIILFVFAKVIKHNVDKILGTKERQPL